MTTLKKALTFGSATIDVIAAVDDDEIERMTMHNATSSFLLLEEGRKIDAQSINSSIGGGGTNAAVSLHRLGFDAACMVRVGKDIEGRKVLEDLQTEGINTRFILTDDTQPTGKSVMISSHVRNPTIFASRGANTDLQQAEITADMFEDCSLVYVAGLSGASAACFPDIVKSAKAVDAYVAVNPGILQLTYRSDEVLAALAYVDLLSINVVEAEQLASVLFPHQKLKEKSAAKKSGPDLFYKGIRGRSLEQFIDAVQKVGPKTVLVTNGSEGAYAGRDGHVEFYPAGQVTVGSTAGAGDAFATTFAAFASQNRDLRQSLQAATLNALSVIGQSDTHSGLLSWDKIEQKFEEK